MKLSELDDKEQGLVVEVENYVGCQALALALLSSCFSKTRPIKCDETRRCYINYLKDLSETLNGFADNSKILESSCDLSDSFHISNVRKKIKEKSILIKEYANNY